MIRNARLAWLVVFAFTIVLAASQAANAQREEGRRGRGGPDGRRFGGGFGSPTLRLAANETVQKALKLSDEQKTKIEELDKQFRDDFRKLLGDRIAIEGVQKLSEDTATKLAEVLDDDQQRRLQGISIQVMGAGAILADSALAKELNVTHEQKAKLGEAHLSNMDAMRNARRELRDLPDEQRRNKTQELHAKAQEKMLAVLTSKQQEQLNSLQGEKVDIDMSQLWRGGRGGFEGRGGRGRGERGGRERGDRERDDAGHEKTEKSA